VSEPVAVSARRHRSRAIVSSSSSATPLLNTPRRRRRVLSSGARAPQQLLCTFFFIHTHIQSAPAHPQARAFQDACTSLCGIHFAPMVWCGGGHIARFLCALEFAMLLQHSHTLFSLKQAHAHATRTAHTGEARRGARRSFEPLPPSRLPAAAAAAAAAAAGVLYNLPRLARSGKERWTPAWTRGA
jgi:hypothetical protein